MATVSSNMGATGIDVKKKVKKNTSLVGEVSTVGFANTSQQPTNIAEYTRVKTPAPTPVATVDKSAVNVKIRKKIGLEADDSSVLDRILRRKKRRTAETRPTELVTVLGA